ncbi:MAG: hypothetical protein J0H94_06540 [Rhizobiales bacterium]|nr:hypothetical protein [Hyphomicrobiales bacterium]
MPKPMKTAAELVELIAAELRNHGDYADTDASTVVIVEQHPLWHASLRRQGPRIDEGRLAAVHEIGRKLASGYGLARESA